jgi:membrane fusion protein (multidrug efflux system)
MKPKSILLFVSILVALILIKIIWLQPEQNDAPKASPNKAQPVAVTGYVTHTQLLENNIFSSGTVMANEEVELRPEVSGKLLAIYFKEGAKVSKGTLLAKINDADLQAQLHKLQLQLKLANERAHRLKALLDINGVSQEEYDASVNVQQSAAADIDFTKAQIAKTEIRAPFNGHIGLKKLSVGAFVTNASLLATMQQTDVLKLDFTIPERYSALVGMGDQVLFSVENQKDTFKATVFAIEPKIDQQTRNVLIRAVYQNAHTTIVPGTFAKVELIANKKTEAIMVPTEAVIPDLKGKKVFVCAQGKAKPVKVITGTRTDAMIEIQNGLQPGDTVITTGIMSLKPDVPVKVIAIKN